MSSAEDATPTPKLSDEDYEKIQTAMDEGRYPCNNGNFNLTTGRCVCDKNYVHLVYEDRIEICNYEERVIGAPSAPGFHLVDETLRRGDLIEDHDASAVLFRSQWGFVGFFLFVQAWCFLSFKVLRFVFRPDKMKDLPPRRPLKIKIPKLPKLASSNKDRGLEGYGPNPYTPGMAYPGPSPYMFGAPMHPMAQTYAGPAPQTPSHSFVGSSPFYPTYAHTAGPSYPMAQSQPQLSAPVPPMYQSPYGQGSPYPMEMSPQPQHYNTAQQLPSYGGQQSMAATQSNLSPGYVNPPVGTYTQPPGYGSPGMWGSGTPHTMRVLPPHGRSQSSFR